jgi:hypothetical protein
VPIPDFAAAAIVFDGATVVARDEVVAVVETGDVDGVLDEQDAINKDEINPTAIKHRSTSCFFFILYSPNIYYFLLVFNTALLAASTLPFS